MGETITLDIKLRAFVRREKKNLWVAVCPRLGVASQGRDQKDAKDSLREAVEAWFESCLERGVLDQAMRESNFRFSLNSEDAALADERVLVNRKAIPDEVDDVLGDLFAIQIEIPAYQAAAFLAQA